MKLYSIFLSIIFLQFCLSFNGLYAQELIKVNRFNVPPVLGNVFGAGSSLDALIVVRTGDRQGLGFTNLRYEAYLLAESGQAKKIDTYLIAPMESLIGVAGEIASNEDFVIYQVGNKIASYNKKLKQATTLATPGDDTLIYDILYVNGRFIYTIEKGDGFIELWRTQGALDNTALIKKIPVQEGPGFLTGGFRDSAIIGNKTLFTASEASVGEELFSTDGTAGSFSVVKDILPGIEPPPFNTPLSSSPMGFVSSEIHAYFVATDSGFSTQSLWVSDATSSGTRALVSSASFGMTPIGTINGGIVYWQANSTGQGDIMFLQMNSSSPIKLGETGFPQYMGKSNGQLMFIEVTTTGSQITLTLHRIHGGDVILSKNIKSFSRSDNPNRNFVSEILSTAENGVYFDMNSCAQSICRSEIFRWQNANVEKVFDRPESEFKVRFDEAFIYQENLFMPVELGGPVTTLRLYSSKKFEGANLSYLFMLLDE